MKKIYFTVGPSQVYPTLYKHLNQAMKEDIPSLNHRGAGFKKLFQDTTGNLKRLLNIPRNYHIFFVSSGLESMERIIQGCVQNSSFHLITGSFGKAWAKYADQLGKNVLRVEVSPGEGIDLSRIDLPKQVEIICITQNDTSTGVWIPEKDIHNLKKKHPEKLIALDLVSSVPYVQLNYKLVDMAFCSVQKGFGLPAGLGVIIVSPKALQKCESLSKKGLSVGSYHSLKNLWEKAEDLQTPETPNVLNIYLLNKVIKDMLKEGLTKIRKEINQKAKLLYEFFDNHKQYNPFVKNTRFRSPSTLVLDVKGKSEKLRNRLAKYGFIIGVGYGENKLNHIRVANFPAHKLKDVQQMLKCI